MTELKSNPRIKKLVQAWELAKSDERMATQTRLDVEGRLLAALGDQVPPVGSVMVDGLKIVTGFTEKWNQDLLFKIRDEWPEHLPAFPFREELKPNNGDLKYFREHQDVDVNKEACDRLIVALDSYPRKPAFTVERDDE